MHYVFFFFNDPATTEIYTLSLHDALPISVAGLGTAGLPLYADHHHGGDSRRARGAGVGRGRLGAGPPPRLVARPGAARLGGVKTEEQTSELPSRLHLLCRLLLQKKKNSPI